jgi:MtN3 and saliva related transmembrane protein
MENIANYIGIAAGICTGISLLPQLFKIIREKNANDISFIMLFTLLAGLAGWIAYGVLKKDYPIIITNAFSLLVNILIIFFTKKYQQK